MNIKDLFSADINRKINGVIKVEQTLDKVEETMEEEIRQEVSEYVITSELRKHFVTFFEAYHQAFTDRTDDIGVWISGFFGSGKSHFLKMLSYILSNRQIGDTRVVEAFREKFDDPAFFMTVDACTKAETDAILFNIDTQASGKHSDAAVLRVFAKMFYDHLGYYGNSPKVVHLEKHIAEEGKTNEFHRVFSEISGKEWTAARKGLLFHKDHTVKTMVQVLGMTEQSARSWFAEADTVSESIQTLVDDIKAYVDTKPANYRLIFMADEVGQYVGADTNMLLKLQDIVEEIGSRCHNKVWVICTGQSALDEVIKVNENAFSRIQARFHTRLNLSSSSVDEVIQKRLLSKTPTAAESLRELYGTHEAVLRNTFSFRDASSEVKGYGSEESFVTDYPFVPYQFAVLQKVFAEIRRHGNAGAHMAGGERSMISGFQESAQKIAEREQGALVPFYRFYDTLSTFLDNSIRRVIDRAARMAEEGTLEDFDVKLLKLLYLIRYIKEVPSSADNLIILMTESIGQDKIELRRQVQDALTRLLRNDFIADRDNKYFFLTDDEQDIQRRIAGVDVSMSAVIKHLSSKLFEDIYTAPRFRWNGNNYDFNRYVDTQARGTTQHPLTLCFLTTATPDSEKTAMTLLAKSAHERTVFIVLKGDRYYETMHHALQISTFVRSTDVQSETPAVQEIIRKHNQRGDELERAVTEQLKEAVSKADVYVAGEQLKTGEPAPAAKLDAAMETLVSLVYHKRDLVDSPVADDNALRALLSTAMLDPELQPNAGAMTAVEERVLVCEQTHTRLTVQDLHSFFTAPPYGWGENDIAGVIAQLLVAQKVCINVPAGVVTPTTPGVLDALHRRTSGNARITPRHLVDARKIEQVRRFAKEAFHTADIPTNEDALKHTLTEKFKALAEQYAAYRQAGYPGQETVEHACRRLRALQQQQTDNTAYFTALQEGEDELLDMVEDMEAVAEFFNGPQKSLFEQARALIARMEQDADHITDAAALTTALQELRRITDISTSPFLYRQLSRVPELCNSIEAEHELLLNAAREGVRALIQDCLRQLHEHERTPKTQGIMDEADECFRQHRDGLVQRRSISQVVSLHPLLQTLLSRFITRLQQAEIPPAPASPQPPAVPRKVKPAPRNVLLCACTLESEAEVNAYVDRFRTKLLDILKDYDAINIQ